MAKIEDLLEAERRGILPENLKPLLEEARRRGLVPAALPESEIDAEARRRQTSNIPGEAIDYTQATAVDAMTFGALPQIIAGVRTAGGFLGDYGRERDVLRRQINMRREESGLGALPGDLMGGATLLPRAAAGVVANAPSYGRQLLETAGWGAAYAGAYGFNVETGAWVDKIRSAVEHAVGGAVAAPALRVGLGAVGRFTQPIRDAFRRWRQARADTAQDFEDAGVQVFAPALGGAVVRGSAEGLSGSVTGSALRAGARESIADLEARLADELTGAGGRLTPAEAGEAAQGFLRRNVLERSRPKDEIDAMTPTQLGTVTRVPAEPIQDAGDVVPRQLVLGSSRPPESYPTDIDAAYAANRASAPKVQENLLGRMGRPAEPEREPRPRTERLYTPEEIEDAVRVWESVRNPPRMPERLVDFIRRMGGIRDDHREVRHLMGLPGSRSGGLIRSRGRDLDDIGEAAQQAGFFRERPTVPELIDKIDEDLRGNPVVREIDENALIALREHQDVEEDLGRLGILGARSAKQVREILRGQRARIGMEGMTVRTVDGQGYRIVGGRLQQQGQGLLAPRRQVFYVKPEDSQRLVASDPRRSGILDNGDGTISLVEFNDHGRAFVQETVPASSEARVGLAPIAVGREVAMTVGQGQAVVTRQAYRRAELLPEITEISGRPAPIPGRPGVPPTPTNTTRLIGEVAREGRGMLELQGYKGQIFGEDGRLQPQILDYLRPRLGDRITDILAAYSERRATRQFTPGVQGLWDIRTAVGRAIDDAQGIEARTMLQRLYDSVDRDIQTFASRVPGGEHYIAQHVEISAAYRDFVQNIRGPLRRILGENVDPVAAIGQLVRATQRGGNIDLLRAYYRVAAEKGSNLTATGWLLHNMAEGGLPGFLKAYRDLSEDARRLMFQGSARALGENLDRLARVGGRLEGFARTAAPGYAMDPRRWAHLGNLGLGTLYFVSLPALITTAIGTELSSRLLASRWFANWYRRAPITQGPGSQEWRRHLARLIAVATESLDLNEPAAEALRKALDSGHLVPGAQAAEPAREPPAAAPDPTALPPELEEGEPRPMGERLTGGPEPDPEETLGGMRTVRPPAAPRMHGKGSVQDLKATEQVGQHNALPAYLAMMGERARKDLIATLSDPSSFIGPGTLTGTVIGRVGAANLAKVEHKTAQKVLRMARELERRGLDIKEIRTRVNRVINREEPDLLGTIVKLQDGQWGVELSNHMARFTHPIAAHRLIPLPQVLDDPALRLAYPQLDRAETFFDPTTRVSMAWDANAFGPGTPPRTRLGYRLDRPDEGRGSMLHEIEHHAQLMERHPHGSGPEMFEPGGPLAHLRRPNETTHEAYWRTAGEWLARQAEERQYMTGRERRIRFLRPPEGQIVHYGP